MKFRVLLLVCTYFFFPATTRSIEIEARSGGRDGKKLFGGYKITPRFCKPTREVSQELKGPNICMFNHECIQRSGIVVGACMDGFLFGACCQLPNESAGELTEDEDATPYMPHNSLYYTQAPSLEGDITSSGVSQITNTLLQGHVIPTAQENVIVQVSDQDHFSEAGVTHPTAPETIIVNTGNNEISPDDFKPVMEDRKTTMMFEETTRPYVSETPPIVQISISNSPPYYTTPSYHKPVFRPKPQRPSDGDKYVLVPTINHHAKPNKTEIDSIVNIIQMLDESNNTHGGTHTYTISSTKKPPSTSYVFSATPTRRPGYDPYKTTTTTKTRTTTTKVKRKSSTKKPTQITTKKPSYQYISSSTFRPAQSTFANTQNTFKSTSKRPPSTSYVYSSTISKRPTTTNGYSVTKTPTNPSPPTVIVLGPISSDYTTPSSPSTYSTTSSPSKRPVSVTINNHITQNIYSTSERPSPTVLITPKPSLSTSRPTTEFYTQPIEIETSADNLINFPPVRNPNLNMSISAFDESEITTPDFIEDELLNKKVESFVNKIIEGLQEPFQGLRDVVYNKNKTAFLETTTKKPAKKPTTTKKTTRKPTGNSSSSKPTTKKPSTVKRPSSSATTRRPTTTSRRTKPTKRITTTQALLFEPDEIPSQNDEQDYRSQCGIRPLMKSGRIVGGKGANFGEFPWQVLVRESTWLGLFTKNKCGGVLISNQYVMTAAHCQPGFLASLVAVFGEFDISGDLEMKRSISRNVKRVIVHREYDAATFENDLALLELEHPVQFDAHIVPICLPRDQEDFTGRMATVTGWGRLKYGGGVPSVLQEVQVPIMENSVCQEMFRTAGHSKVILESFLCAGYANGQKDSCEGDSGGPLVLQRPDGRYQLAGTVSHGIKCAAPYLPGVYMRTTYYKPWIESITGVH